MQHVARISALFGVVSPNPAIIRCGLQPTRMHLNVSRVYRRYHEPDGLDGAFISDFPEGKITVHLRTNAQSHTLRKCKDMSAIGLVIHNTYRTTSSLSVSVRKYIVISIKQEFQNTELGKCIKNIKTELSGNTKITRPDPSCYFPQTVIDYHLQPFTSSGAAHLGTANWIALGNFATVEHNGIVWVAPYTAMVTMLQECVHEADGNATSAEVCTMRELGEHAGSSDMFHSPPYSDSNRVILVEVCNTKVHDLNIRIPSGNEPGASDLWFPGGYTSGGMREAIVDAVPSTDYCWHAVSDTDGAFCYDMNGGCDIECNHEDTERKEDCSATSCSEASCANSNNDDNYWYNLFLDTQREMKRYWATASDHDESKLTWSNGLSGGNGPAPNPSPAPAPGPGPANCGHTPASCNSTLSWAVNDGKYSHPENYPNFKTVTGVELRSASWDDMVTYFACTHQVLYTL